MIPVSMRALIQRTFFKTYSLYHLKDIHMFIKNFYFVVLRLKQRLQLEHEMKAVTAMQVNALVRFFKK